MPVTNVRSRWSGGDLIYETLAGTEVFRIADSKCRGDFETAQLKYNGTAISATAAELNILDGVTSTAAEINELAGMHAGFTFAAAQGAANITEVTVTAVKADGSTTVAGPMIYHLWLSDAATGAGLTGTAASGTVTVKSASGAVIGTLTSKKALVVQALASGVFILEITDTAKTAFYVCAQTPHGEVKIATILATGDYG